MDDQWRTDQPSKDTDIFGQYRNEDGWETAQVYWWQESMKGWSCREDDMKQIYLPPGRCKAPDRWKEPISEARCILNQMLTILTTMGDSAETLLQMNKQLINLGICSIYDALDAEFYHSLYKQWWRVYYSMRNIKFSDLCSGGLKFHHAKAQWLKERQLKDKLK